MRLFLSFLFLFSFALLAASSPVAPPAVIYRLWTDAELWDAAHAFAKSYPANKAIYLRFISLSRKVPSSRARALQGLGFVTNSLSRSSSISLPRDVPGTEFALAWLDLSLLRDSDDLKGLAQLVEAWDRLAEQGSGKAPFHEPFSTVESEKYYEATVYEDKEFGYYQDGSGGRAYEAGAGRKWVTTERKRVAVTRRKSHKRIATSDALNHASREGLTTICATAYPLLDYRWFCVNALSEPRYHELLGLDDTEASVLKLADADEKAADGLGAQVRGAVLFSEVGDFNRFLERTPTRRRYGRGSFHRSFDFKAALRARDIMRDTLNSEADAHEIIFTLPNGNQGFFVSDNKKKRLDKADADIAINRRGGWHDPQVRTSFMCIDCHLRERGWIEVADEVRDSARLQISILSKKYDDDGKERSRRIQQKYLTIDYNELLQADQAVTEAAVIASTSVFGRGLTPAETRREIIETIRAYVQEPVTLEMLAFELGVTRARLIRTIEANRGLDHTLPGLRAGRPQRRDHIEACYGQIATVLYRGR